MPRAVWSGYSIVFTDYWLGWDLGSPITTCLKFAGGKAGGLIPLRFAGTQRQALPRSPTWTHAMGTQRRSRRRGHAEKGKNAAEISAAGVGRQREAGSLEGVFGYFQARSAAVFSCEGGGSCGGVSCGGGAVSCI